MRRIAVELITPGMKLAKPVHSAEGKILLGAGMEIKDNHVERFKELGISTVFIHDEQFEDVNIPEVVPEEIRLEAVRNVKEIIDRCKVGKGVDVTKARSVVNDLVDEILAQRDLTVHFLDMRVKNDYLFSHSVNVCTLSIITGIAMGYDQLRLRDLGVGALLHDIGKIKVPEQILNKPGTLTEKEFAEMQKHPQYGFEMLRATGDISLLSAHIAYQHHERCDGSGYPRGLKGSDIHEFAQIVAVADVYDAMTSDQVYRNALPVYEAVKILNSSGTTLFNPEIIASFAENIAVFPVGSVVRLNTQQIAVVVSVHPEHKLQPVVRILIQDRKLHLKDAEEIDLMHNPDIYITDVIQC